MAPGGATFLAGLNGERQFDDRTEREDRQRSVGHRLAALNDCTLAPHLDLIPCWMRLAVCYSARWPDKYLGRPDGFFGGGDARCLVNVLDRTNPLADGSSSCILLAVARSAYGKHIFANRIKGQMRIFQNLW